jgi:hypothetical protein
MNIELNFVSDLCLCIEYIYSVFLLVCFISNNTVLYDSHIHIYVSLFSFVNAITLVTLIYKADLFVKRVN